LSKIAGPSVLDVHFLVMLAMQMVGIVGRLGSLVYTDVSSFGCISATSFLIEYLVFVPSVFACAAWLFRTRQPDPLPRLPGRHIYPGDSDYAFLSSDHETDKF